MSTPWKAMREAAGTEDRPLSQRAVERELGWSRGRLSVIERGLVPTEDEARQLRTFYGQRLTQAEGAQ